MSEWISVKDKLPEKSGRYLVYEVKGEHSHNCAAYNYPYPCCKVNIAYFRKYCPPGIDWMWNSFDDYKCNPTHWMELVEAPKDGNINDD